MRICAEKIGVKTIHLVAVKTTLPQVHLINGNLTYRKDWSYSLGLDLYSMARLLHFCILRLIPVALIMFSALAIKAENGVHLHGAIVQDNNVVISWKVDNDLSKMPKNVVIRYNRSSALVNRDDVWKRADTIPYTAGYLELKDLNPYTTYVYQLGYLPASISNNDSVNYIWTSRKKFETKIPWGPTRLLFLIGALSLFIFGMKTMSEGIQSSAGIRLRQILESMTKNRLTGVLSGLLLTAVLQSSSATTVMTVSFVNAGLISLAQSAGIMMGANIGTTITSWIVSLLGFRVDITIYSLVILAIAAPLVFMRKTETRSWGTALIGFALLFLGLGFLKETVPTFTQDS